MPIDVDEAKQHLANRPVWHHIKGKAIEVGLYMVGSSIKLNKPAPRKLPLWTLDGKKILLEDILRNNEVEGKATILNIGSFTCPVWRERQEQVQMLASLHQENVACITIYVREAHASDEWELDMNEKASISYRMPRTIDERIVIAERAKEELMDSSAMVYVDGVDHNSLNKAYSAVPIRICVIGANGDLVFRSKGHGPFGYKPEELAEFLKRTYKLEL